VKYQRRTDEDRIAELNAKIEGIRTRAERRAARADPVQQQARIALKAIDKALDAGATDALRATLETAAGAIRVALDGEPEEAVPRGRRAKARAE
jgi:hypothetical protein